MASFKILPPPNVGTAKGLKHHVGCPNVGSMMKRESRKYEAGVKSSQTLFFFGNIKRKTRRLIYVKLSTVTLYYGK